MVYPLRDNINSSQLTRYSQLVYDNTPVGRSTQL